MLKLRHGLPFTLAATIPMLLAGCATPEMRVRDGLMRAGLNRLIAGCMAERMVDRLSLIQLRRIGRLGDTYETKLGELTVEQFLHNARALRDTEILAVMTTSGAICAVQTRR